MWNMALGMIIGGVIGIAVVIYMAPARPIHGPSFVSCLDVMDRAIQAGLTIQAGPATAQGN